MDLPDPKQLDKNEKAAKKMEAELASEQKELAAERKLMAQFLKAIDGVEESD